MTMTLGAITLPRGLRWADEFAWSPRREQPEPTITGALVIDVAELQAGRPITLVGDRRTVWPSRTEVLALQALIDDPPASPIVLTLHDARTFNVRFSYADGNPMEAAPRWDTADPSAGTVYVLTRLSLIEVA